jgi:dTDP-4-dehydrorhamnose reductase
VRVLITGAGGQLAGEIIDSFKDVDVRAYLRKELDITSLDSVLARARADRPDVIINCAAYNDVERAQDEAEVALEVNAFGVRCLARAASEVGAALVHYSTDFVFDGRTNRPYVEEDPPNPQSVYAQSKLLGEWFALEAPRAFVLRVESLFGGRAAKSSIDRIRDSLVQDHEASVFVDRTVSPSYVADVAAATRAVIERGEPGLYHCVSTGYATWFDVAQEMARIIGKDGSSRLRQISVSDVTLRAPRPQFAALSNEKLRRVYPMPDWQDALRRYLT